MNSQIDYERIMKDVTELKDKAHSDKIKTYLVDGRFYIQNGVPVPLEVKVEENGEIKYKPRFGFSLSDRSYLTPDFFMIEVVKKIKEYVCESTRKGMVEFIDVPETDLSSLVIDEVTKRDIIELNGKTFTKQTIKDLEAGRGTIEDALAYDAFMRRKNPAYVATGGLANLISYSMMDAKGNLIM